MKTGVDLIAEERQHQIIDKGYDSAWIKAHPEYYSKGQLSDAAIYSITGVMAPLSWPIEDIQRLAAHEGIKALQVAGALLAAEIDRLQSLESEAK